MTKKTGIIIALVVIAAVIVGIMATGGGQDSSDKQITIGVSLPLTGDLAFIGRAAKPAIKMAIEDLNSENTKYLYDVVFQDDAFSPKKATNAVNKLISTNNVDALISFGSPAGNAVSPIAKRKSILHINALASDPAILEGDYNFIHHTPPDKEGARLAKELVERDYSRPVLFTANHAGAQAVSKAFRNKIEQTDGISIVSTQRFNPDERDFRSYISKAEQQNPDIYVFEALSPTLEPLAKQYRDTNVGKPVTTVEAFEFTSQPELFEGEWYVHSAKTDEEFASRFKKRTGNNVKIGTANAYDAVRMIAQSFEWVGKNTNGMPSTDAVAQELHTIKGYDGALGTLRVRDDGRVVSEPTVKKITNGEPVLVEE
jgi:branched-chain amino acid transport system substrate-binding protein